MSDANGKVHGQLNLKKGCINNDIFRLFLRSICKFQWLIDLPISNEVISIDNILRMGNLFSHKNQRNIRLIN